MKAKQRLTSVQSCAHDAKELNKQVLTEQLQQGFKRDGSLDSLEEIQVFEPHSQYVWFAEGFGRLCP